MDTTGIILSDDIIARVGVERTALQIREDLAELARFRLLANSYTETGTPDDLQNCLGDFEELVTPRGRDSFDQHMLMEKAQDNVEWWEEAVENSTLYEDMVEEKDDEIESLHFVVANHKSEIKELKSEIYRLKAEHHLCATNHKSEIISLKKEIDRLNAEIVYE